MKNLLKITGVLFLVMFLFAMMPAVSSAEWTIDCVDCPPGFDSMSSRSIAVDSFGNPHIVFSGPDGLYYAYYDGASWNHETIAYHRTRYPSIAIDSSDNVHISYYDFTNYSNEDLKYVTNASGSWVTETLDSAGNVGLHNSIAIDSADNVHISYIDYTNDDLKYATNASGSWVTETVDSAGGLRTSIAIDSSDNVHISYIESGLKYATNASGSWVTETVDSYANSAQHTSIAIDSSDNAHISYTGSDLKYATNASGSWVIETVDSTGWDISIALDSLDNVHISYYVYPNDDLKYATNASGSWVTQTVDSAGDVGLDASIAIDSSDNVHISYYDRTNGAIKYAINVAGSWVIEIVDDTIGSVSGSSIALDSLDNVHMSYSGKNGLMHATNASGSWVTEIVDSDKGAISIAIDSSDNVHISYHYSRYVECYDPDIPATCYSVYGLKYATNASGSWVTEIVPVSGTVSETSIALDSSDNVHISYYLGFSLSSSFYELKYATNASGSWVTEIVDSYGDVGSSTSIALDSLDNVHISYYDRTNGAVKYAINASGSWVTQTVDTGIGSYGSYTSIALDSSDNVHISYYDRTNGAIKYVTNASGLWVTETVNSAGGCPSIALDPSDNVHIGYSGGGVKYVTNASGLWVTETVDSAGGCPNIALDSSDNVHIGYHGSGYPGTGIRYAKNVSGPDTTPPNTTITSGPPDPNNSSSATFEFTSTETGSTFECALDSSGYSACTSPVTYTGLSDGTHTFNVRATDQAGNTDPTPASYSWTIDTIDTTPPDTAITSGPPVFYNKTSATFAFTSTETGSTFECELDSSGYSACTSPMTYTGLSDGTHTFNVRATDQAGNTDPTPASYSWTIDTIRPIVTITSPKNNKTYHTDSVELTFYANEPTRWAGYKLDNGPRITVTGGSTTLTNLSNGSHKVEVSMADLGGKHGKATVWFKIRVRGGPKK